MSESVTSLDPANPEDNERLLTTWAQAHYGRGAIIEQLRSMPGHAGISFGFDVLYEGVRDPLVVRVAPQGVRRSGNTDVLRQVPVLRAAAAEGVPVAEVRWWSADERWFNAPYLMVRRLSGGSIDCWQAVEVDSSDVGPLFESAVEALVAIHNLAWPVRLGDWAAPRPLVEEINIWEPILAKGRNDDWTRRGLALRDRLLATCPPEPEPKLFHGDFYSNNWVTSGPDLLAIVDWEIAGIGPALLDIGWLCMVYDPQAWGPMRRPFMDWAPSPEEIGALYEKASGQAVPDLDWYRALAAWRLSSITALNYRLHATGRRPDETYELMRDSMQAMVDRAMSLLG